jgi:CheY-like chemotaxis protein
VSAPGLPDFSGLLFLVVEDDADSREFLHTVLERCGARVIEADTVAAARQYVETLKIDLIITDLALPNEDGAMFLKWLRARPAGKGGAIPAIAVTAYYEKISSGATQRMGRVLPKATSVRAAGGDD